VAQKDRDLDGVERTKEVQSEFAIRKCRHLSALGNTRRVWIRERFQATSFNKFQKLGNLPRELDKMIERLESERELRCSID
jgi:hypothetical protein